jgi:tripartite-type tricarboxylate transporter receptor subunit TctC
MIDTARGALAAMLAMVVLAWPSGSRAQDYPNRPVRIVLGFTAGTGVDILARVVGARLSQTLGQQFIVENKAGAGSILAADTVARAPKDGYTLLMATVSNSISTALHSYPAVDFQKDFAPIVRATTQPNILAVHPSLGVKSVKELVDLAKAKPNELSIGSSGTATGTHLAGELFKMQTGVKMVHVPYPGSPQSVADLIAGRIQVLFAPSSTILPHVRDGKIVALASTEAKRTSAAPDLPTMQEAGLPGYEAGLWFGLLAPAGTPTAVVDKLNRALNEALKTEEVAKALAPQGIDVVGGSPEEFARFIDADVKRWAAVGETAGLRK